MTVTGVVHKARLVNCSRMKSGKMPQLEWFFTGGGARKTLHVIG